jgi:ABC-type multidrug transport system fused ATPase/permease subunit
MKNGSSNTFLHSLSDFWVTLGLLQLGYFILSFLKYALLSILVLNSNEEIHREMIYNLVRSPSSYFDTTSTGNLSSKFSNDFSIMDNTLSVSLIDSIEGPIMVLILVANVISINKFFLIPGVINIILLIIFFLSYKNSVIAAKQL